MNILQNTVRNTEHTDIFYDGVEPKIDFRNQDLCSYIFCKSYVVLNICDSKTAMQLASKIFSEKELTSSRDIKEACLKKMAECFSEKNPLAEIIDSKFMKNFAEAFKLTELDMKILLLTIFFKENNWNFKNIDHDYERTVLMGCFIDHEECYPKNKDAYKPIETQYNLLNSGVFSEKWKVSKSADFYFTQDISRYATMKKLMADTEKDVFSVTDIEKANKTQMTLMTELLSKCRDNTDGFFMTMFGQEQSRAENFIVHVAEKNNFSAFKFYMEETTLNEVISFLLVAFSAQLADTNGVIVLPEKMAEKILEAAYDKTCISMLNLIECPIVLLTKPFEDNILDEMDDSDDSGDIKLLPELKFAFSEKVAKISVFNWKLEMPAQSNYKDYFANYLKKFNLKNNVIECAVNECSRLKITAEHWESVANFLTAFNYANMSEENIRVALESMIEKSDGCMKFRQLENYDTSVLKTSIPIEELEQSIINAEKFQAQNFNIDSGIRILLYGISGAGKTAFVEHIAKKIGRQVISVSVSDIERRWAGQAEQNIVTVFKSAVNTGSILLIDEADSLLADRRQLNMHWQRGLVNEFIQQMERFPGILFCATNLADYLDSATNRRFHIQVKFEPLDKTGVEKLCSKYFENVSFTDSQIKRICDAGDVCPGDFGAVSGMLRFSDPSKINAEYISNQMVKTVKAKDKTGKHNAIGFR